MLIIDDSGANLSGVPEALSISMPGSSIFDNILSWINTNILGIFNAGGDLFVKVINAIGRNFVLVTYAISDAISRVVEKIAQKAIDVMWFVFAWSNNILDRISSKTIEVINAAGKVTQDVIVSVATTFSNVIGNMMNFYQATVAYITNGVTQVISSVATTVSSVISSMSNFYQATVGYIAAGTSQVIAALASGWSSVTASVGQLVSGISQTVVSTFSSLSAQVMANFTWITDWLAVQIPKILGNWWDLFLGKIFDFSGWVGKLFDAVAAWFTRDVPGHSPWWHFGLDTLFTWIKDNVFGFFGYFFSDPVGHTIYGLNTSFAFIGDFFGGIIDGMLNALVSFIGHIGPGSPEMALSNVGSIGKVAMASLTALAAMTLTGEVVGFWKHIGLGNISAIFYDMSNYKLITAGLMGALVGASIRIPLGYYFNSKLRPKIPGERELLTMYTDENLTRDELMKYLGYHGIPDGWVDRMISSSWKSMSPFQLKTAAQDGSFDETIFYDELTNAGFKPQTKKMLMDSFRKASLNNLRPTSVSSATYRYKNGWTDEDQFMSELKILQVGDAMLPVYLASSRLDYASDYLTDLETAYTNAVRSGHIGIDEFRQSLLGLGMVPQRVEGKVFIEQARTKPKAALSPVASAQEYYLTDAGKVIVDTNRRKRRASQLTRSEEMAAFSAIGMPVELATAYADNDDTRLKEPAATSGG